jgi:trimethylamine:corrinoid methyltransferase-like protein
MDMEVILQACRYGVPIHACSVGTMGGTSPISPLGTTILCCIEVLVQLIIAQLVDNSIAAMMKHLLKPMTLDNPSLSWEEIISVPAGGHFLEMTSTLDHCRDGFSSVLYINGSRNDWVAKGENDFISRAREKVMECWNVEPEDPHLDNAIKDEMDSIVRKAEQELCR